MFDSIRFSEEAEALWQKRRAEILNAPDTLSISGRIYYVSSDGCDRKDGRTPDTAWKTLRRVSDADLREGDGVLFRRGDIFRGTIETHAGVAYGAYGTGEKPKFYGWNRDLADPALWTQTDETHRIWKLNEKILDPGTLVFNDGEAHCRKLIPSYLGERFVCRDDEHRDFVMQDEMTRDLDLFWHFDSIVTRQPSKGEDFPIPVMGSESFGDLYLRCDRGNPGECFQTIEALPRRAMFSVGSNANVRIDNLCLKYIGLHAIAAGGYVTGLHVTNCEIGWIGGTIQHYFGTDPNFPEGRRGTVTRFGNGVEIYGGCDDYRVENCYIYQCYDAGITHQKSTDGALCEMKNIKYIGNLVEKCVYGIEYFLDMNGGDTVSFMKNVEIRKNILRLSGYGWGQQRHNTDTPALIKGWSYVNRASEFRITDNVFDRCAYRMLHLVAKEQSSCPDMDGNVYIQHEGGMLGQYGGNEAGEPGILYFDENTETHISETFADRHAEIHIIK
ncbi:MAG: hypothetical protein IIW08_02375 [Clostridia bacterium]|nr:hypothetical protein [Clostridia bacterium]MBQ5770003.1 hypothetical protein [Clostridia bacterium]